MPPRISRAQRAVSRTSKTTPVSSLFSCPSCCIRTLSATAQRTVQTRRPSDATTTTRHQSRGHNSSRSNGGSPSAIVTIRNATTLASRTAINAPRNVPPVYRDLYQSLHALKDTASDFVNQSRLQLALRGLESSHPTVRIGILGLGRAGEDSARKLARILLADPLSDKEAWEERLVDGQSRRGALLLRFGNEDDVTPQNPLLETVNIPSRVLQRNNLEILISSLDLHHAADAELLETILVPPLQTPIAASGRAGYVRYPVHKALLVGEGIDGCMAVGRLSPMLNDETRHMALDDLILSAVNLPQTQPTQDRTHFVDVREASQALDLFREDVSNGPTFSHKWQNSGMPSLSQWLTAQKGSSAPDTDAAVVQSGEVVRSYIHSVLTSTGTSIASTEAIARAATSSQTIPESTRTNLQTAVTDWAQSAHTDLQHSLDRALASRSWKRTSWYKLLWRVDDVGVAAEDVLRSHWLLEAETRLAFLAGRVEEAGFFRKKGSSQSTYNPAFVLADTFKPDGRGIQTSSPSVIDAVNFTSNTSSSQSGAIELTAMPTTPELLRSGSLLDRVSASSGIDMATSHSRPWPMSISFTRQTLLHTLVPSLQFRAQSLLFQCLSTIGGTSALGAWFYAATYGSGLYEAGAISALGIVWSFRRLQRRWEEERVTFTDEVREDGRVVLAEVENVMRVVIRDNERAEVRVEDVDGWNRAREQIKLCEEELTKLK